MDSDHQSRFIIGSLDACLFQVRGSVFTSLTGNIFDVQQHGFWTT